MNTQTVVEPTALQNFMDSAIVTYGLKIIGAIIVILFLLLISKFIAGMVRRNIVKNGDPSNKHIDKIWKLIHDITFYILVIFSFFIGFEMVGFNVGLIVWGISFGVGLAFKEILGNMIAGIMILYTKEFKLGDIVEIQADQAYLGRIEEITIRYTVIRTLDLRQVVLPNMTLISVPIKTFSAEPIIKLTALFGVHYDSDVAKVLEVILNAVNSFDFVKEKTTTKVFVSNFADSYIEIKSLFSFDPNCGLLTDFAIGYINEKVNNEFAINNINVPYNMLTINFEKEADKQSLIKNIPLQ
ncbi:MAG: Small-conductance mechanosensitive channel [uncultured bacterium (gcode 4)]|uniref:Small-conductance mechanosensitive channel n=1 Tax=uncultured bacterium (gcode 4) TaxID=1234023 RepID=K1YJV0_9BACT|nr:MAG: Small-conductance mechanosensitive channel [uncultured bacterium (gcode 4)]